MAIKSYLARLVTDDIPQMEMLEAETRLSFWGAENYRRFLEDYPEYFGCKLMVLRANGKWALAGFLLARSLFENLEILKIGIFLDYQGLGFGTQLMQAAHSEGQRRGCTRCFLEVRESNQAAIRFYCRNSYRIAGKRMNYYSNPVENALIMERSM